ncbi:TVG1188322 [Thermoplasma volcanium GSS1]|uniref:TVG1188322 protein n=1 Tax=Thermoplasma volcanium (strain ATCC 51530 / DSM 4299 / JCM 9571 / NBRC 15438 / GSS1) TaxID=273116 RepID=Q979J9_THEVO|nr:TVG1188322 [Thermoplasma volcanium GSS1]
MAYNSRIDKNKLSKYKKFFLGIIVQDIQDNRIGENMYPSSKVILSENTCYN